MKIVSTIYENRLYYYELMKDFLEGRIKAYLFRKQFWHQRNKDLDDDKKKGFYEYVEQYTEKEQKFTKEYFDQLYCYSPTDDVSKILCDYVKGAEKYQIKGYLFFIGIYDDLSVNIRDFYPRNVKEARAAGWDFSSDELGFPEFTEEEYKKEYCIDEKELRKKVQEKFDILEKNKDKWM
jgi:hypothetical protein